MPKGKGERTRERIKADFAALLQSQAFASVTIADICRASGITVGGFYFHFASQEDLLEEVMTEHLAALLGDLDAALDGVRPGASLAQAVCGAFLTAYATRTGLARTFLQLTRMRADYATRWRDASEGAINRLSARIARERPDLAEPKALFLAYALVAMVMSRLDLVYVYRGRALTAGVIQPALLGELVELWDRMVGGAESP